jgi:lipoprotein-anchoring transpeptidase ErfK/SrfK
MLSTQHWRLAVSALAATILCSAQASAGPLAMSDPNFPFGSLFQQVVREPAPQAMPEESVTEQPSGVVQERFRRQMVNYNTSEAPGTIVIDTPNTYLYLVLGNGKALRYAIGVGRQGFTWSGVEAISRTAEWPDWYPPAEMIARQPYLPRFVAGGPGNPLGARALYLGHSQYRIHGTNDPSTIGHNVSSGCIRLTNQDVIDLFGRVKVGTKVVVLPQTAHNAAPSPAHAARTPTSYAPTAYAPATAIVPVATASTRSESGFAFGLH